MILETLLRRMATGEKGPVTGLKPETYTLSRSFSHEPLVPVANPSSPIAFCTGRRSAAIQRPLKIYASRLVLCDVVVVGSAGEFEINFRRRLNYWSGIGNWRPRLTTCQHKGLCRHFIHITVIRGKKIVERVKQPLE